MNRYASVETIEEIIRSMAWKTDEMIVRPEGPSSVRIEAWPIIIKIKQHEVLYHWTVSAIDDPNDKDEGYASDPIEEILEFIYGSIPGGEKIKHISSNPTQLASLLRKISLERDERRILVYLRRIYGFMRKIARNPNPILDLHEIAMNNLKMNMDGRRWSLSEFIDDNGLPAISFEIANRYEGKITLADILYVYEFGIEGRPESIKHGVTNSIVFDLKMWVREISMDNRFDDIWDKNEPQANPVVNPAVGIKTTPVTRPTI